MEYNRIKYYCVRLELIEELSDIWEDFNTYIKIFEEQENIKLIFDYWYDGNKIKKLTLIENAQPHFSRKYTVFDIAFQQPHSSDEMPSKYYFSYTNSNSFMSCIFELFSFIKAILNHEDTKNENRNDRQQTIYKKTRNKRFIMDDKKQHRR